jgi:hypothetical protein
MVIGYSLKVLLGTDVPEPPAAWSDQTSAHSARETRAVSGAIYCRRNRTDQEHDDQADHRRLKAVRREHDRQDEPAAATGLVPLV